MRDRACELCGATNPDSARYCCNCGASLDATVIHLERTDRLRRDVDDALAEPNQRLRGLLLIGALGIAVILAGASFLGGNDDDSATRPEARPTESAEPSTVARATPVPETTPTPTRTPRPTPRPVTAAPPVDPEALPPMDATHLAAIANGQIQLLDLRTGIWTLVDGNEETPFPRGDPYSPLAAISGGFVAQWDDGTIALVRVDGTSSTLRFGGNVGLIRPSDTSFLIQRWDGETGRIDELATYDFEGSVQWTLSAPDLPPDVWSLGVLASGEVALQWGEQVAVLDPATSERRGIATGSIRGIVGADLVIWTCDETLTCAHRQIDRNGDVVATLGSTGGWFEPIGRHFWRFSSDDGTATALYELVGSVLTEVADNRMRALGPLQTFGGAIDATGLIVRATSTEIEFVDPRGSVIAAVPAPIDARSISLALLGP